MSFNLVITKDAFLDERDAFDYYENIQEGLGFRFLKCLENRYAELSEHPHFYSFCDSKKIIRDVVVDDFPYVIIFEISGTDVIIYSVHNTHKLPKSL